MNSPIIRLYGLMLLLFAALVGFTSYWAVFDADNLRDNPDNRRPLIAEQTVERGIIETADGVTVAESFPVGGGKNPVYVREYPQGKLFGHPVGYSFIEVGRSGIERSENGFLAGERNEFASIIDQIRDVPQEGDDVTLTIDAQTQGIATQALESAIASNAPTSGVGGGVVAIEPDTGAVRVMASSPGFDPNGLKKEGESERLNDAQGSPLLNRPTQSVYPARLDDEGRDRRGGPRLRRDSARHGDQRRLAEGDRRRRSSERGRRAASVTSPRLTRLPVR